MQPGSTTGMILDQSNSNIDGHDNMINNQMSDMSQQQNENSVNQMGEDDQRIMSQSFSLKPFNDYGKNPKNQRQQQYIQNANASQSSVIS